MREAARSRAGPPAASPHRAMPSRDRRQPRRGASRRNLHAFDSVEVGRGVAVSKRDRGRRQGEDPARRRPRQARPGPATIAVTPVGGGAPLLQIAAEDFRCCKPRCRNQRQDRGAMLPGGRRERPGRLFHSTSPRSPMMIFEGRAGGYRLTFRPGHRHLQHPGRHHAAADPAVAGLYDRRRTDVEDDSPTPTSPTRTPDERVGRGQPDWIDLRPPRVSHIQRAARERPRPCRRPDRPDWHVDGSRHFDHHHRPRGPRPRRSTRRLRQARRPRHVPRQAAPQQQLRDQRYRPGGHELHPAGAHGEVTAPGCGAAPSSAPLAEKAAAHSSRSPTRAKRGTSREMANGRRHQWAAGDPLDTDGMSLCFYDESGNGGARLRPAFRQTKDARTTDHACWKASRSSYRYVRKDGKPDGIADGQARKDGRAHVIVKAAAPCVAALPPCRYAPSCSPQPDNAGTRCSVKRASTATARRASAATPTDGAAGGCRHEHQASAGAHPQHDEDRRCAEPRQVLAMAKHSLPCKSLSVGCRCRRVPGSPAQRGHDGRDARGVLRVAIAVALVTFLSCLRYVGREEGHYEEHGEPRHVRHQTEREIEREAADVKRMAHQRVGPRLRQVGGAEVSVPSSAA